MDALENIKICLNYTSVIRTTAVYAHVVPINYIIHPSSKPLLLGGSEKEWWWLRRRVFFPPPSSSTNNNPTSTTDTRRVKCEQTHHVSRPCRPQQNRTGRATINSLRTSSSTHPCKILNTSGWTTSTTQTHEITHAQANSQRWRLSRRIASTPEDIIHPHLQPTSRLFHLPTQDTRGHAN
ncbi:unnamed protein product [Ectocarpus sp. 8 AP-2014]